MKNIKIVITIIILFLHTCLPETLIANASNSIKTSIDTSSNNDISSYNTIPISEKTYFNSQQIKRGKRYMGIHRKLWLAKLLLTLVTLILLIATPTGLRLRIALAIKANGRQGLMTFLMISITVILLKLIKAPLAFFSSFTIPHHFEISNQTLIGWLEDYLLSSLIDGAILIFTIMVLYKLMTVFRKRWWIVSAIFISTGTTCLFWLSPLVISPLFNSFTPLQNHSLEIKIRKLAQKAKVPLDEILIINASKRTKALNAYYTGLGNTQVDDK
jgi:STE24 endopeptidase